MKNRIGKILALVLALALLLGTTAVAETAAQDPVTITITWWGGQGRHDYTQKLLDLYTSENPHVTFEAVPSGWDGYFDKLATNAATASMPDIVQMDYMYIATYAANGTLADIGQYIADGVIDVSGIDANILASGNIGGKAVGLPLSTSIMALSYNPAVLEEAGVAAPTTDWTWAEFQEIMKKIASTTGKFGAGYSPFDDTNILNYWVRQHGSSLFAADKKSLGYEDDAILTEFLQLWKDLIDAGAAPNPDEYEQIATLGKEAGPVITGNAGFRSDWNNYTVIAAGAGNATLKMVTPPLRDSANEHKGLWLKPGMFFSIAESSKVKDECARFINWFVNSEEANAIIMGERGTPISAKIREYLIASGKLSDQQIDMFNYVDIAAKYSGLTPAADPAGISEINRTFKDIAYSVFYGQRTPAEAAAQFRTEANEILAANN